jgi:hypothetical protein
MWIIAAPIMRFALHEWMERINPAELDLGHEEAHALVRFVGAGAVVEEQQDAGGDLDAEQEQRHPAPVVPERVAVDRDFLVLRERAQRRQAEALVEPLAEPAHAVFGFSTTTSSPTTCTSKRSSGRGGGPEMLWPSRS